MSHDERSTHEISRRSFLRGALVLAGATVAGCTPARVLFRLYDDRFDRDPALVDSYLRAFTATIVPGAPADDPNITRMFRDTRYPFAAHLGYFTSDLARRSLKLTGSERFDALGAADRELVVRDGLRADDITSRLYRAAILLTQVSFYGSIHDDENGCALIDFPGENSGFTADEMYYPNTRSLLGRESTRDGNPL